MVLVSATPLAQTASYWAQGGLAAALAADDSFELHLRDTELAGRALVRRSAAEILVREAPECVRDLQALGVRFDADRFGHLALGLEGGHSVRRVVHAGGSATGRRVVRQLSALAAEEPRITVLEGARAQALWRSRRTRCRGLVCDDGRVIAARAVVIATGGAAALWARTTNPPGSQGVGLLLAHAAGAALADLELLQFHPTAVIGVRGREGFLVTEAIRGEGATLHDASGERFVDELAPRDEVSRAIQALLERVGTAIRRPRHARDRPSPLPQRRRLAARGRPGPHARADPGRAGRPLHDGRHRHRPARPLDAPRPVRGRASPPAPACTAPTGSPRTRSASASCSPVAPSPTRCRGPRAALAPASEREMETLRELPAPPVADAGDARGAVARRGHRAHAARA